MMSAIKQKAARAGRVLVAALLALALSPAVSLTAYADEGSTSGGSQKNDSMQVDDIMLLDDASDGGEEESDASSAVDEPANSSVEDAASVETETAEQEEFDASGQTMATASSTSASAVSPASSDEGIEVQNVGDASYNDTPIEGITNQPGFRWVDANQDMPAHYEIYNPVGEEWSESHEACVGWWHFAKYSRTYDFDGYLIQLNEDLDFSKFNFDRDSNAGRIQLSVGSEDMPFKGTFDGKNHTISNLKNEREGVLAVSDCGFFGVTREAVIKNINFDNCYVGASGRSGLVAGYAQDTLMLNILCTNCTSSVIPANNVINLITNAGLEAGMIAGETNGSTLYNCEMRAGRVVCNATAGLAAAGGQTLYMGGLVGFAQDTVIEYSRVSDIMNDDGTRTYAEVKNQYESAVNVANYSELFTGGIVGGMQAEDKGSKVIDCYCTADVYSWSRVDFAVTGLLGAQRGYTGGIVGMVRDGSDSDVDANQLNVIQRVSYAGNLHSYNYNIALLGIPIIEEDGYLGAITGRGGGNATIDQAYFLRSASSTEEEIYGYKTTYDGGVLDGPNFGPRDEDYEDRNFWEGCDFDFAGGALRNIDYTFTSAVEDSEWAGSHYNKWVMDYKRGIPVHGGSIKAALDFPGSGTTTIGRTSLAGEDDKQSTTDPYDFAVQGYLANDESIDVTFALTKEDLENSSWTADDRNEGYRFMGWYGTKNVQVNDIDPYHSKFTQPDGDLNTEGTGLIAEGSQYQIGERSNYTEPDYKLTVNKPDTDETSEPTDYADNNLYVAYAQAQVLLHDVSGNLIDVSGVLNDNREDDWYDYEGTLTLPTQVQSDHAGDPLPVSESATLIGWTTRANMDGTTAGGYPAITSTALNGLKTDGVFWEPGAVFTVIEPCNLYPVYSDYISNITVIYEGNERDNNDDVAVRERFGKAVVKQDADGHVIVAVQPQANSPLIQKTTRFLGWYENVGTTEAPNWVRVSNGEGPAFGGELVADNDYFVFDITDAGIDMTQPHTYMARFEYQVTYCYYSGGDVYTTDWSVYNEPFENYRDLDHNKYYSDEEFYGWYTGSRCNEAVGDAAETVTEKALGDNDPILYPMAVHGHWSDDEGGKPENVFATTDFPGSAAVSASQPGTSGFIHAKVDALNEGYNFHFWSGDADGGDWQKTSDNQDWDMGTGWWIGRKYWAEAHMTANVTFKMPDGTSDATVERRYQQPLFDIAQTHSIKYHYANSVEAGTIKTGASTNAGAALEGDPKNFEVNSMASDAAPEGYAFLGWVDYGAVVAGEMTQGEWEYIFDGGGDLGNGVTSVAYVNRVLPYLEDETEANVCLRPAELHPVYVKVSIETTTNLKEAGVPEGYNQPGIPGLECTNSGDLHYGMVDVEYNPDKVKITDGYTSPVELKYDRNNGALQSDLGIGRSQITIGVDQSTCIKGESGDLYQLVSVTVSKDGGEPRELIRGADGAYSDIIQIGSSYVYQANYSPVPLEVVYHLHGGESTDDNPSTEEYTVEAGNRLPAPQSDPSWEGVPDDAFFVGWSEQSADYGGFITDGNGSVQLVNPGVDLVDHSMHLWPVYRTPGIYVNSNIDSVIQTAGDEPGSYRYLQRNGDGMSLVAKEYPGYEFQGWYTGYSDDENPGTPVTSTFLSGGKLYDGTTYTAVYTQVYEVRYHDTKGNVIYTARVSHDDERTFYQQVPVMDPETGEQQKDEEGNPVFKDSVIDAQAFLNIASSLEAKDEQNPDVRERFETWQWVKSDGTAQRWADEEGNFTHQKVVDNAVTDGGVMNLYPITMQYKATDANNSSITDKINWSFGAGEGDVGTTFVVLNEPYAQPFMHVHVKELAYDAEGNSTENAMEDHPVTLYMPDEDKAYDTQLVEFEGYATFRFYGTLRIEKTSTDPLAAGRTFTFLVSGDADQESWNDGQKMTMAPSVTLSIEADNGVYSGFVEMKVPYGTYTVEEEGSAWRYDVTWKPEDMDESAQGFQVKVGYEGRTEGEDNPIVLVATNARDEDANSWLDGDYRATNVFANGTVAKVQEEGE